MQQNITANGIAIGKDFFYFTGLEIHTFTLNYTVEIPCRGGDITNIVLIGKLGKSPPLELTFGVKLGS